MKDYKKIVSEIVEATEGIKDEKLKEIAFQKLLEHSLESGSPAPAKHTEHTISTPGSRKPAKKRSASSSVKDTAVRDEVKTAFSDAKPIHQGLKPLRELKQSWLKYVWVLVVAKDKGIDRMTNAEIAYILTEKFSVAASDKLVNNLTFKVEAAYVQKTDLNGTRAWRVLIDGIEAVKAENDQQTT